MKKKRLYILIGIFIIGISIFLLNYIESNRNDRVSSSFSSSSVEEKKSTDTDETEKNSEFDQQARELVENQFSYFQSIVNGHFFVQSRQNGPKDQYSEDWVTESVKNELQERVSEIDELLPEQLDSSNAVAQDLLQVLIRINQAYSQSESQKNIYHVYRILYELNGELNDYKLEEGMFDPENDWSQVFSEVEEEQKEVKSEAELQVEIESALEAEDEQTTE
ncbi:hypothetical protein [Metabacillus endolithicus]|uniref:Uncharacterized protein n=1 Tax=Metabacillus endolithicus TaxID=1535204 RepID=A0ABW5C4U0_9BACI|nr:hypothetical protein [Metabacillus endolithicus]UPG62156.1 hypothetical protein MVE64_16680 [Metabacillus endolithicus]